jgi:hypothetical protein
VYGSYRFGSLQKRENEWRVEEARRKVIRDALKAESKAKATRGKTWSIHQIVAFNSFPFHILWGVIIIIIIYLLPVKKRYKRRSITKKEQKHKKSTSNKLQRRETKTELYIALQVRKYQKQGNYSITEFFTSLHKTKCLKEWIINKQLNYQ